MNDMTPGTYHRLDEHNRLNALRDASHASRHDNDLHILVVDDDASIRQLVAELLRDVGYVVYEAQRGDDGVDMAHELHPDVVLMDLMLPGVNGVEATRRIKHDEETNDIRIIAMSAVDRALFGAPLLADAFLRKPFDIDDLLELVVADKRDSQS